MSDQMTDHYYEPGLGGDCLVCGASKSFAYHLFGGEVTEESRAAPVSWVQGIRDNGWTDADVLRLISSHETLRHLACELGEVEDPRQWDENGTCPLCHNTTEHMDWCVWRRAVEWVSTQEANDG